jgi:predicted transcriptional regulator of viral defense system
LDLNSYFCVGQRRIDIEAGQVYIPCPALKKISASSARLERHRAAVISRLERRESPILSALDLRRLFSEVRAELDVPSGVTFATFLGFLVERCRVRRVDFATEGVSKLGVPHKALAKFVYRTASPYALGLSLKSGSYLTHATAVFLHALTDELPKTIYVNKEQTPKPRPSGPLTQEALARAFANKPRQSQYVLTAEGYRYVLLSGKNTGRLEVSKMVGPEGDSLDATKLERTLIDIVVRPVYAGGPHEVLNAYRNARDRVSIGVLVATLRKLDYIYPYHQAIGFYMSRAGYKPAHLDRLKALGINFDFYLANATSAPLFDSTWRIFHPPGL